jgi:hypothetical protein
MIELHCQFNYSQALLQQKGTALWQLLDARSEPMRPWTTDEYVPGNEGLREACEEGEDILIQMCGGEWILSMDFDRGSLIGVIELPLDHSDKSNEKVVCLQSFIDSLCGPLQAPFAWMDAASEYPRGLAQSVLDTDIKWLFWFNYYGPAYVQKFGADCFRNAPFYEVQEIAGGGLRCTIGSNPLVIDSERVVALIDYFDRMGLKVTRYG